MPCKIVWTEKANEERIQIFLFWIDHNKSKRYSIKLNKLFITSLKQLAKNPLAGRKTDIENVRVKIVRDYLIFYEIINNTLVVLAIWDGRRDKKDVVNKLKK